jgi:hypothetical protein
MQTICNDINYCADKVKKILYFFRNESNGFENDLLQRMKCYQGAKEHFALLAKRKRIAMVNNDQDTSYLRVCYEEIDAMKE